MFVKITYGENWSKAFCQAVLVKKSVLYIYVINYKKNYMYHNLKIYIYPF